MAILSILHYPDPRLHTVAKTVETFDGALEKLSQDMLETMYEARGIGLAATQVNVHYRVVVMDLSEEKNAPQVFINPEIIERRGECVVGEEGCLSVPGIYESVERYEEVTVRAQNLAGEFFEMDASGLAAVCLQHELDHLAGKVFVQYLSRLKQNRIQSKLKKQAREAAKEH